MATFPAPNTSPNTGAKTAVSGASATTATTATAGAQASSLASEKPIRPARPSAGQFWLRRALAALVVGVFLYGIWSLASLAFGELAPSAADASPSQTSEAVTYIVQDGDTLWSIAGGLDVDEDLRVTVDALIDLNGSPLLEVGQRLVLP